MYFVALCEVCVVPPFTYRYCVRYGCSCTVKQNKETKEYHSVMAFVWHFYRFYLIGSPPSAPPFSSLIRSRTGVLLRLARRIGLVLSVFTTLSSPRRAHPIASTPVGSARTPSRRRPRDRTESAPTAQHRQLLPCAGSIARHHP